MRIRKILFTCMLITGVVLAFFVVAQHSTSVVYTAESNFKDATKPTLVDRIFKQMDGVFSLAAQTIQAVMDIDGEIFTSNAPQSPLSVTEVTRDISDSFVPKLFDPQTGSLLVNVPFSLTHLLTVQGESSLASTTVAGVFVATGSTELNELVVGGDARMERLAVVGSTNVGSLQVRGQTNLEALRIGGVAQIVGALTASGGITTRGATVDLEGGSLFAANVINELIAGDNISITGTLNAPIISARRSSVSTPNLETVRARGGCLECITDSDVVGELSIIDGVISSTTIGLRGASIAAFTDVTIGTTSATSTLEVHGAFELAGLLTVQGMGTSTFDGGINVTGGCVAVNGNCLGVGATYLGDLLDVDVATALDGEILMFDGSEWISVATSTLAIGAENLSELDDVLLSSSTVGDLLSYDGTNWINVATSTLGFGDGSFLGLRDTPSSYVANAISFVNATSSALTHVAHFVFDGNHLGIGTSSPIDTLSVAGTAGILGREALRFYNTANTNYVGFRASSTLASNIVWSLPVSDGGANEILVTDGSGNLRFAHVSSVGGGSDTFVGLSDTVDALINKSIPYVSTSTLTFSTGFVFDGSRLGVGTSNPTSKLTVQGGVRFQSGTSTIGFIYDDNNNKIGIGTVSPAERLTVENGSILQRGATSGGSYELSEVGSVDLPSNVNDVKIIGRYAYVVSNSAGDDFHIIDISDPNNPVEIGSTNLPASALGVYVSGSYAYVATDFTGDDFHIIDISDPANPVVVGSEDLQATATDVVVQGRYAYVTTSGTGDDFHVIDITDVASPALVGSLPLSAGAYAVVISGLYAYVGTDSVSEGFYVIDISDPANPTDVSSLNLGVSVNDIAVQGQYAYVASAGASDHFFVVDISDALLPVSVGTLSLGATANSVAIAGLYAYVVTSGASDDVHVVDLHDVTVPVEVGSVDLASGSGIGVAVSGRYAYVTTSSAGDDFHVIDVTGIEAQSSFVHSFESGTLSTLGDATVAGLMSVTNGLRVGLSGIQTSGPLFVQGVESSFVANNLGVGTTSAAYTLTVGGDVRIEGALYDSFVNSGFSGYVLQSTATGTRWKATSTLGFAEQFTNSQELAQLLSDETGTGNFVLSDDATLTGILSAEALTLSSTLTFTGSAANISLGSNFLSGDGNDEGIYITASGEVGVGTTSPTAELGVQGTIQSSDLLGGTANLITDAQGNIIRDPSDVRLKTDITTIDGALEKMLSLRGVSYHWRDTERFGEQTEIGFIAQEVDEVLPEVVRKGGEYWSLNTRNILAVVIEGFKEMWAVVQGNQEKIELLEDRIELLEAELQITEESHDTQTNPVPQVDEVEIVAHKVASSTIQGDGEENLDDEVVVTEQETAFIEEEESVADDDGIPENVEFVE